MTSGTHSLQGTVQHMSSSLTVSKPKIEYLKLNANSRNVGKLFFTNVNKMKTKSFKSRANILFTTDHNIGLVGLN